MSETKVSKELIVKAIETISKTKKEFEIVSDPIKAEKKIYSDAISGKINGNEFKRAVQSLFEADEYLYKTAPNHELNSEQAKEFSKLLFDVQKHINKILSEFGFNLEDKISIDRKALYIVSNKKLLKSLKEIDSDLNILSTEGVLEIEDMKIVSPEIPEKALLGIEKKCKIIKEQISKVILNINPSKIYVVVKSGDTADELIFKRAKELYGAEKLNSEELL
ncbi:conserved hypothetical protein [Methanococcus vannielii SB]|jgi:hypothetical protein|uniref:Uncharacterized protein n=1 Tax=Methanococcus vannielii (strain ATCC 35089 / DSM 1224 / JCM 13029 / OCM 148 / SB) TaxID=406327 RepID=A6UPL7_METVS|nr:DUF2100 domain-containing protein [Methanococcus vannielii]ABR54439.1 conserved hypothetical protein [Methanococcus vannielii SB]